MNKKDIIALVEGRLSGERKREVIRWLIKNPKQQRQYNKIKAEYVAKLLGETENANLPQKRKTLAGYRNYLGYAASLVLMFTLAYMLIKTDYSTEPVVPSTVMIETSIGENRTVELGDGTMITLNANTSLSYPKVFSGKSREVILKGEAFFDVAHNPKMPFVVNTDDGMKIQVLGTKFNVKSYPEDQNVETTLISGKVRVVEEKDKKTVVLNPSQRATYVKDEDKIIVDNVKAEDHIAWRQGKLIYDETPIRQVISDLKRMYKVSIRVESQEIMDYEYTGIFDNLTIEQVMDLFEVSSPVLYKMNDNQITLYMEK